MSLTETVKRVFKSYLMSGGDLSEIRDVGDRTYREPLVHQTIVDKHVGDPKHRYS